jgi:hypothetical protein
MRAFTSSVRAGVLRPMASEALKKSGLGRNHANAGGFARMDDAAAASLYSLIGNGLVPRRNLISHCGTNSRSLQAPNGHRLT